MTRWSSSSSSASWCSSGSAFVQHGDDGGYSDDSFDSGLKPFRDPRQEKRSEGNAISWATPEEITVIPAIALRS